MTNTLQRINLTNVDYNVKKEFKEEADKRKMQLSGLFEEIWLFYKLNKLNEKN